VAGTSLLALLDDIASVLDDIAAMSKVAAKKTAGVLGDDLALNAEQVTGVRAERELPIVWAVAKGSVRNKLILVPVALLISGIAPWLVTVLLMLGGIYLSYEGFEKVFHKVIHKQGEAVDREDKCQVRAAPVDLVAFEKAKIKGAIRTDFILSAEIIVIALGTVQGAALTTQIVVVAGIALTMTCGVYALVAGIVKLDDVGLFLLEGADGTCGQLKALLGKGLLRLAPGLMKTLAIIGTAAMFMVGGGILVHGLPGGHHLSESLTAGLHQLPNLGTLLAAPASILLNLVTGAICGAITFGLARGIKKLRRSKAKK
jgi:predicted DNA repair protein MutK